MINKGDVVRFYGGVVATYEGNNRTLVPITFDKRKLGIVIGYSFLRTGKLECDSDNGYAWSYLYLPKDHKVYLIEPFERANRYLKPYRVFAENIEVIMPFNQAQLEVFE